MRAERGRISRQRRRVRMTLRRLVHPLPLGVRPRRDPLPSARSRRDAVAARRTAARREAAAPTRRARSQTRRLGSAPPDSTLLANSHAHHLYPGMARAVPAETVLMIGACTPTPGLRFPERADASGTCANDHFARLTRVSWTSTSSTRRPCAWSCSPACGARSTTPGMRSTTGAESRSRRSRRSNRRRSMPTSPRSRGSSCDWATCPSRWCSTRRAAA